MTNTEAKLYSVTVYWTKKNARGARIPERSVYAAIARSEEEAIEKAEADIRSSSDFVNWNTECKSTATLFAGGLIDIG